MERHSQIIWTFEGKISDHEKFYNFVNSITRNSYTEVGAVASWWTINRNKDRFHLLEITANAEAAMTHLDTWAKLNDAADEAIEIEKFTLYSDVPQFLDSALSKYKPTYMRFYEGWIRYIPNE